MLLLMQVFAFGACDSGETQKDVDSAMENTVIPISYTGYYSYVISNTTTFVRGYGEDSVCWFIFCSSSASALRFHGDKWYNITSPPFAYGVASVSRDCEFTVETDVTTSVVVFALSSTCESGAYLMAGGTKVEMHAVGNSTVPTTYCVFSPSTDGQEVEVTYGLSKFIDRFFNDYGQWATLEYYTDLQVEGKALWSRSQKVKRCVHSGLCKERLENAAFYVVYRVLANSSDEMFYSRKNLHASDKFCGCTDAQIPYERYQSYPIPFDTFWAKKDCDRSNIGLYVGISIGCVIGLGVIIATLVLIFNPKAREMVCGCFKRKHFTDDNISASLAPYMESDGVKGVVAKRKTFQTE